MTRPNWSVPDGTLLIYHIARRADAEKAVADAASYIILSRLPDTRARTFSPSRMLKQAIRCSTSDSPRVAAFCTALTANMQALASHDSINNAVAVRKHGMRSSPVELHPRKTEIEIRDSRLKPDIPSPSLVFFRAVTDVGDGSACSFHLTWLNTAGSRRLAPRQMGSCQKRACPWRP
jgi:hypothetical protein